MVERYHRDKWRPCECNYHVPALRVDGDSLVSTLCGHEIRGKIVPEHRAKRYRGGNTATPATVVSEP